MTPEEKQKLYDAIGYQENVDTVFPKEVLPAVCLPKGGITCCLSTQRRYYLVPVFPKEVLPAVCLSKGGITCCLSTQRRYYLLSVFPKEVLPAVCLSKGGITCCLSICNNMTCGMSLCIFWNSLPPAIRLADSVDSFKVQLKTYLFSQKTYPV